MQGENTSCRLEEIEEGGDIVPTVTTPKTV